MMERIQGARRIEEYREKDGEETGKEWKGYREKGGEDTGRRIERIQGEEWRGNRERMERIQGEGLLNPKIEAYTKRQELLVTLLYTSACLPGRL